ncbi:MAG: hypothetical protein IPN20_03855 [Haliscomenobacter sp.]|nr:hypothetical protein [Haliscomenobacter sp.]
MKQKFHLAYESIKPINIIRHTLKEAAESVDIKENLFITSIGIISGFLTRKYVAGNGKVWMPGKRSYLKTLFRVWAAFLNPMAKAGEALSPFEGG